MNRKRLAGAVLLGFGLVPAAICQAGRALPSAEQVLDRYVAVSGGQAAYDRVQSEVKRTTVTVSGAKVAETVSYTTRNGNFRFIARGAGGQSDLGVNDGVAWTRSAERAEILETGEDRAQALQSAELLPEGHWRKFYKSVEMLGPDAVDGRPCYKLKVVPFAGEPHTLWYDQRTGLEVKEVEPVPGGGEAEMTGGEYFESSGIRLPHVFQVRMNGVVLTTTVDDVRFEEAIPDSVFALPPDIERLMKRRFSTK